MFPLFFFHTLKIASLNRANAVKWFDEFRKKLSCIKCGEDRWWVLDFHHRDPSTKEGNIAKLKYKLGRKKMMEEVNKCDVLCSNCHRDLHYQEKINKNNLVVQ